MSVLPWPKTARPAKPRKLVVDPLPDSVLRCLVPEIPGPKGEPEAARAARYQALLDEVLAYKPRNAAEAMMASQCVMLRHLSEDCGRDTRRTDIDPTNARKAAKAGKEFDQLTAELHQTLRSFQKDPLQLPDPEIYKQMGLDHFLVPEPARHEHPDAAEEAFSAVIVPLHPAPKMLQ